MIALIIGGQGFIGQNLIRKLTDEGYKVRVFSRSNGNEHLNTTSVQYIKGQFENIQDFPSLFKDVDVVYHLLSTTIPRTSNDNPTNDIQSNVLNTIKLLEICKTSKIKKIVFTSSGGTVYGLPIYVPITEQHPTNPICSYGITKLMIEKYLYMFKYLYGLDYKVLRISNPYGPYQKTVSEQGVIGVFLGKILRGETIEIWGDGSVCRDYIYIDDVVEAIYLASVKATKSDLFNVGSGIGTSLSELLEILKKTLNREIKVQYKQARTLDSPISLLDSSVARKELGWIPEVDIRTGIEKTWDWMIKRNYY